MNKKRIISILILAVLIFTSIPIEKLQAASPINPNPPMTPDQFVTYLEDHGFDLISNNRPAELTTFNFYGLVVYGKPWGDPPKYSDVTKRDEKRYLGWDAEGNNYTNTYYPNDDRGTKSPLDWTYIPVSDAQSSWDAVKDTEHKNFMLDTDLGFLTQDGKGVNQFIGLNVRTKIGQGKARLQNPASLKNGYSIFTQHYGDNKKLYYATLYGPSMDPNATLECKIDTADGNTTYYIRAGEESVEVPVKASATAKTTSLYVKPKHIKNIDINFMGIKNPQGGVLTTTLPIANVPCDVKYTRSELGVGEHPKTLTATATMQSTFQDGYNATASKNITIVVEENGPSPYASATIEAQTPIRFNNSDVSVEVKMTGIISNLTDLNKIKKVIFHMRKDPVGADDQYIPIEAPIALSANAAYTFTVPASKLAGVDRYTQLFAGRVEYILTDDTRINSPMVMAHSDIYKVQPPPPNNLMPPIPIITAPDTAIVGSSIFISGSKSYDPDGIVEEYEWYFTNSDVETPIIDNRKSGSISYKFTGRKQIILGVTDDDGQYSEVDHFIEVTPPYPIPIMQQSGTLKVNRKITVDASPSFSHPAYPINHSLTSWAITPVTSGITAADIKYSGSLAGIKKDFLVKKPGQYKVSLTVFNTAGMSSTNYQIIDIVPDKPPIADFTVVKQELRDPSNYNKAKITLVDQSYSEDADYVDKRIWKYAYDSNNNGLFTDETWKLLDSGNNTKPELFVYDVGRYAFELEIEEAFGQPTIPEFIALGDILKANTLSKLATDKIVEVINVAPVADISANKTKNIDLVVISDYTGDKLTELGAKLNQYVSDSFNNNLNVRLNVFNGSKYLGRYIPEDSGGFSLVNDEATPKYTVANWNGLTEYSDNTYNVTHYATRVFPSNVTTITNDSFPVFIKKSIQYNSGQATLWLLENGDLYFMGTNSLNNASWYSSINMFAPKPIKIMSNVKQIEGNGLLCFILTNAGDVYAIGNQLYEPWQPQSWFYNINKRFDLRNVIPNYTDDGGSYNNQYGTFTGYTYATKVNGLSNLSYIWSNGNALVARNTSGKWYGLGRGLNAFGLSTGFVNTPPASVYDHPGNSYVKTMKGIDDYYYADYQNYVVEITNLSALDSTLGGIDKVEPNKVYARSGEVYSIKETPATLLGRTRYPSLAAIPNDGRTYEFVESGYDYYDVFHPFQVINSLFAYTKTGTWTRGTTQYATTYNPPPYTVANVEASGTPTSPYLKDLEIPTTGNMVMHTSRVMVAAPAMAPKVFTNIMRLPVKSGITDYNTFAYVLDFNYSHLVYDSTLEFSVGRGDDETTVYGGYKYFYNYVMRSKVIPFARNMQVGRKVYSVNIDDLSSMSFRPKAEKYVLYLGEQDSFQKISKDITNFILDNNVNVKVSAKSSYIDAVVDTTKYINLRQFATVTPKGAIYAEYQADQMLHDITNENLLTQTDNKLYVLKDEDTVEYLKYFYDYENDIMQAERFKYDHEANYFENSLGLAAYSGQWLTGLKYAFDKVGKYVLTYQAQDNPKNDSLFTNYWLWSKGANQLEIYVHRRPIADFLAWGSLVNSTTKSLNLTNYAYDLDHQFKANKGIVSTEWKWKYENGTTWSDGFPSTVTQGNPIYIWQRVLDEEGVWSHPTMKLINFEDLKNPPVAQFTISKNVIKIDELLKLRDTSYPREGTLTRWHWIIVRTDTGVIVQNTQFSNSNAGTGALAGFDSNVQTNYNSLGAGTYRAYLRVKDSNNLWSDVGTDSTYDLNYFYSQSFTVINPPIAQFTIAKNPIKADELLKLRDTSYARTGILTNWHWIVVKLDNGITVQNAQFASSNNGTGVLAGYDSNVTTDYEALGAGSYRIYLRVKDSTDTWSDGGTDASYNLNHFYSQLLTVEEPLMLRNFRVQIIRDLQLVGYYKNISLGTFPDKPIYVNNMAIDGANFGITGLTKGYMFEFEIDSINFNEAADTIEIMPHFYTADLFTRDALERDLYWEDSKHKVWKAGQGGHSEWNKIILTSINRRTTGSNTATWRGKYLIPGTAWAVPLGTSAANAKAKDLKRDIIVSFHIKGYKAGVLKYDYNISQWPLERTHIKNPYLIGDVIKYDYSKSNLDDIKFKDNR